MNPLARLGATIGGAFLIALGSVLGTLLEPILGFLALRGLQALANLTGNSELQSLYKQAVATYNARGGSYVDKAAEVAKDPAPSLPAPPGADRPGD